MKHTLTAITLASLAATAAAQPAAPAKPAPATPAATTPAAKGAPATPPAAKGAPATPPATPAATPAAKVAPPPATDKAAPPAQPVAPPKPPTPPQEIVDLGKAMAGTWKCTGQVDIAGTKYDVKATITHKVDATLGKFWIVSNFTGTVPKMPPMKFTAYTGYDANTKKLFRTSFNAMGGHGTTTGTYDAKKIVLEGESSGMHGVVKVRQTEEMVSPKETKVSGEVSKDGGKTWVWDHEASCKK